MGGQGDKETRRQGENSKVKILTTHYSPLTIHHSLLTTPYSLLLTPYKVVFQQTYEYPSDKTTNEVNG